MKCGLCDSLEWLYPDSKVADKPALELACDCPANGVADVNVLFNGLDTGRPLQFSASIEAVDQGVSEYDCRFFRLVDVPVEKNTGPGNFAEVDGGPKNEFVTRRAPFRVYDAMEPLEGDSVLPAAKTMALRFRAVFSEAGTYRATLKFSQGKSVKTLAFETSVHEVFLPEVGRESFPYTNWISYGNIAKRHGIEPWSERHYRMIAQYARLMASGRQNTFIIPLGCIFEVEDGMPLLNEMRLERLVKIFTDAGLHYIEGGHFGSRSDGRWNCPTFSTVVVKELATSPAGCRVIASIAGQLMGAIRKNGWQDRWIQHVADEPIPDNAADYRMFCGIVRRYMPGIPLMDATQDPDMAGAVDAWCPLVDHFEAAREKFDDARKARGDKVWYYTCCCPGGRFMNRLLDNELLRPLYLGWAGALYGLDGFLHWGLNQYPDSECPFNRSVIPNWGGGTNALPPGDTHVVYPGPKGPWPSVRFEAMRQGFEDGDLLRRLRRCNAAKADELIGKLVRGFGDYTPDVALYRSVRRELFKAVMAAYHTDAMPF